MALSMAGGVTPDKPVINDELLARWQTLLQQSPGLRIRHAAQLLGVSELSLARARPESERRALKPEFQELMVTMATVGPVMILTRNDQVVHEVTAPFGEFTVGASRTMGLSVGDIDVRVFFRNWCYGYVVEEQVRSGLRQSLQFFDQYGGAVHKIYKVADTDAAAWDALVSRFLAEREPAYARQDRRPLVDRTDPRAVDADAFRASWAELKDVHHFGAMLKKHQLDRLTALELIGEEWATRLPVVLSGSSGPLDVLLGFLRDLACPAMFFVGNPGIVQIYTGVVQQLRRTGPWMNVLDPGFNLHVNTLEITDWWVVRRPSADGVITSVEAFNGRGELVLTVFGKRKPGQRESELWRETVAALEALQ